ncbi:MAG: M48 family metallopeptidase [Candidatus Polarisedimenticolaceae bacterium]|nr:M48 family metallopeptidase [Candidatus Polarisedimenticolaceae bacterium]
MEYSNPKIPEGINSSKEHPLKEFSLLLGGISLLIAALFFLLAAVADLIAPHIPFEIEQQAASQYTKIETDAPKPTAEAQQIQRYLQQLADDISAELALPAEMPVTVHYVEEETVNAFATLGGHIIIMRGLLEKIPDENVLTMVMAHEIAHIKHRDPIRGMGRAIIFGLAISTISMAIGNQIIDPFIGSSGMLTALHYGREQETEADEAALPVLYKRYGHLDGATELFRILNKESAKRGIEPLEFLSTHPESQHRIERIKNIATTEEWPIDGQRTPLPTTIEKL